MTSIRSFLVVILISTITLVSFLSTLHGYREGMKQARLLFENQLRQQASILEVISMNPAGEKNNFRFPGQADNPYNAYQVFNSGGELVLRSLNAPDTPMAEFIPGFSYTNFGGYRWHTFVMHDHPGSNWIAVAEREDIRYQLADSIIRKSAFPVIVSIPVTGILIWFIVSIGLKPIHRLAKQLRTKGAADLSPLHIDSVPAELTTLATSANDLLNRLERSFSREKRFNSDVAHELRTPIAALNIHLHNLFTEIKHPTESAVKLKKGLQRINHLVEQIILLNRMIPDHYRAQFVRIDLFDITRNVIEEVLDEINEKQQTFEYDGKNCVIFGDSFAVETMLINILRNAIRYTPVQGKIVIRIKAKEDQCIVQIMDNGPGIPAAEYDHVFDRFYRMGGDRNSSQSIGCGLGLSIVQYIAELHGARLLLAASEFDSGLLFSVSFPISRPLTEML